MLPEAPGAELGAELAALAAANAGVEGRENPCELWRPFTTFQAGQPGGGPVSKLAKMRASLRGHLGGALPAAEAEALLDAFARELQAAWKVDLGY